MGSGPSFQLRERKPLPTGGIRSRMQAPFPDAIVSELCAIVQRGPGSAAEQFARQTEIGKGSSSRWKRTQSFGRRKASRTLHRTGALEAAWTGRGPGGVARAKGARGIEVGVDPVRFPQSRMFQRRGVTMIRVSPKMRAFVGLEFGVWMKESTTHIRVEGRPISMNRQITGRSRKVLAGYFARGVSGGRRAA